MKKRYQITARAYNKSGRLISVGYNSYVRSHPIQKHFAELVGEPNRIYLHAEIQALLRAGDHKIHTVEVRSENGPAPYPCKICQKALEKYGVKKIIVTSSDFSRL